MKKSTLILIAALLLPIGISILAAKAKQREISKKEEPTSALESLTHEKNAERTKISRDFTIDMNAGEFEIVFDETLHDEVSVSFTSGNKSMMSLSTSKLAFSKQRQDKDLNATIHIPTNFDKLHIHFNAGSAELKAKTPISLGRFTAQLQAGSMHMTMNDVNLQSFDIEIDATDFKWKAEQVSFVAKEMRESAIELNAGSASLDFAKASKFNMDASMNAGSLELNIACDKETLEGLSTRKKIAKFSHAPNLKLSINAGSGEVSIGKFL